MKTDFLTWITIGWLFFYETQITIGKQFTTYDLELQKMRSDELQTSQWKDTYVDFEIPVRMIFTYTRMAQIVFCKSSSSLHVQYIQYTVYHEAGIRFLFSYMRLVHKHDKCTYNGLENTAQVLLWQSRKW